MKINRYDLQLAIPVFDRDLRVDHYVIVVTDGVFEAVCAKIKTLDDSEWFWGHYFHEANALPKAVTLAYQRAGIESLRPLGECHPPVAHSVRAW